jgi:type IV pilus assembly protein PilQ
MPHQPQSEIARRAATAIAMAALATMGAVVLSARSASAPVRLLAVSAQANAVLIESSEPVAYAVKQPDPLTLLVELRGVSIADATNGVVRRDPVAAVTLEQDSGTDGRAVGRVRVSLARPSDYVVRSARNTIRVELTPAARPAASAAAALVMPEAPPEPPAGPVAGKADSPAEKADAPVAAVAEATVLERIRTAHAGGITTVTLTGNGRLTPANVSEAVQPPRRLLLEFVNVTSKAPDHTTFRDPLVKRVQVLSEKGSASTRVAIEVAPGSTYHVARVGADERDLAVVFESSKSSNTVMLAPEPAAPAEAEPAISMAQAIANAAPITPADAAPADPLAALKLAAPAARPATVPAPTPLARAPRAADRPRETTPPPAQQPAGSPALQASTGQKVYTGHPITLDFVGADLRSVLREFHNISGLNIIIDPAVPATPIDIQLNDIPWDQAFETLLRTHQLGYEADGTIIRIAPLKTLEDEQKQRQTLAAAKAMAGTLQVQTFPLSYAKAAEMQALLVKSALSERGQIQVDPRTNVLIITDLPDRLQTATNLIRSLDAPEPQVEVEARVVQTTREFAKALGVQWGLNGRVNPAIGNTTSLAFPNSGSISGRTGGINIPTDPSRATGTDNTANGVNLGVPGATSAIGLAMGAINGAFNLDVALSALERSGKGRVLSTPRLTTQNNIQAEVAQGVQVPIQTVANNTVTVTFRDAVLKLIVTPQITSANTVIMKIELENATPDFSRQINGIPPIDTQRALTQVQVNDGATTVIGGIFVSREQVSNERVPVLYRMPLLGWLFKRDTTSDESRELLIFITPRILRG